MDKLSFGQVQGTDRRELSSLMHPSSPVDDTIVWYLGELDTSILAMIFSILETFLDLSHIPLRSAGNYTLILEPFHSSTHLVRRNDGLRFFLPLPHIILG